MSLNSEYEIASRFELDPKPTVAHSALQAFQKPFYEVGLAGSVLGEKISPGLSSPDFRKRMAEKIDVINNNLSDPRLGTAQVGLDYVSNFAGSIAPLAPLGFVGGAVGRFALGASGIATRALAPEAFLSLANKPLSQMVAGNYARYFPLIGEATAAKTTKAAVEAYTAYKGFTIPEHIAENYHKENDVLNTREAIHDWAADNYGFLLPTAALAGGYVLFKATKIPGLKRAEQAKAHKVAEEHRTQAAAREAEQSLLRTNEEKAAHREANQTKLEKTLNEAVEENRITEKERDWYLKYLENPNDHEAHFESSKAILDEAQIPYDRVTGKHWFQILDSNDVKNLKNAIADQAATNFTTEETRALSTYIVHNRMDAMRSLMADNPNIVHAIKGYTTFIDSKLGRRAKHFQDFDTILDTHLPKGLGKNELFSQKSIYNHLRKNKIFDHSEVPYSVPEKVAEKLALERKYHRMKSPKFAKYRTATTDKTIETLKQQIKDLELFTPEQELKYIRDTLFENKTLRDDFKSQKAFHRLQELSEIWANAKHLLNRIHMEQEYGRQEAFNTILKRFVDMVDSNAARIANPERVTEYIKRRVESTNPELASYGTDARAIYEEVRNEFKGNETKREGETGVEEKAETKPIFDALKKQVDDFGSEFDKEEFGAIEAKLNQLSANEKALSELIECALGESMAKPKVNKGEKVGKDCIENAKKALSHFTDQELKDYVSSVNQRALEYEGIGRQDAVNRAIQDINKQEMDILLSQAATKANDALKLEKKTVKIKKGLKLPDFLHMTNRNKDDNIQVARYKSKHQLFNGSLGRFTPEQYDILLEGKRNSEIYSHLNGKKSLDPEIAAIADIIREYPEFRNLKMIQSNALQPHEIAEDRFLKTTYNQERVLNAGQSAVTQAQSKGKVNQHMSKEYFVKRRIETIDLKKTFGHTSAYDLEGNPDMAKITEIVSKSYDNIVRGTSQIFVKSSAVRDWEAVQRSRRMFYHPKDWESWASFNDEFGTGSLFTALIKDIETSSNSIGMAEIMGSNPDAMYNAMRHVQQQEHPDVGLASYSYADGLYKNVRGIDQTIYSPKLNNVKNALISLSTMNRLGKLPIQSISDVGQVAAFAKRFGFSYWSNYFDGIIHQFGLFPDEARIRLAKTLKMDLDVHMGYLGKFAEANNFGEVASKVTTTFFKYTGMTALDNGNVLSSGAALMKGIGHDAHKSFAELGHQTRSQMEKFNISDHEWDALRSKVKDDLFAVDIVDELDNAEIRALWDKSDKLTPLSGYRDALYNKVFGMFNMAKENTVLNPAAFESMLTGGNYAPGTSGGILLSLFRQFKQYPIAYFRRVWNGGLKDFDTYQAKLMYAFTLTSGVMMANSLGMILEAIAEGKSPPDFGKMNANEKFKFLLRMAIPGAGVFMRVLDQRNENKHLVTNLLMSPSLDLLSDGLSTGFALMNGDLKLAKRNVKDFVKHANPISTIPFADPFFESLMGDKPYLAPGQHTLY